MFQRNYLEGKKSETESIDQLSILFDKPLKQSEDIFSHFDYYDDNIFVELKTRKNIKYIDDKFYFNDKQLDTLIFDAVKIRSAFQYNKRNKTNKEFYMVWKIQDDRYFYWKLNWNKKDYYLNQVSADFGHATEQTRDIVYVHTWAIQELVESSTSLV